MGAALAASDDDFTPEAARDRARRVEARARAAARWHGWVWLAVALLTPVFWIGTRDGGLAREHHFWLALAFGAAGLALTAWEARRGVIGRRTAQVDRPTTAWYVAAMLAVSLVVLGRDPALSVGFVALALLPSVPCVVAAWRILRG